MSHVISSFLDIWHLLRDKLVVYQFFFFQFQDSVNTDDQYNVVHSNVYTASSQVYIAAGVGGPNLAGAGSNLSGYNVIAASVDTSSHAFQSTNGTLGTENYQQQTQILSAVDPRMTRRHSTIGESLLAMHSVLSRDRPRFFDQVGHQTTNASVGKKHISLNNDLVRLAKIMNRDNQNWALFLVNKVNFKKNH